MSVVHYIKVLTFSVYLEQLCLLYSKICGPSSSLLYLVCMYTFVMIMIHVYLLCFSCENLNLKSTNVYFVAGFSQIKDGEGINVSCYSL